jgi:hypothetical protein
MKGYCVQTGSYLCDLHARDRVDTNISSFGFAVTVDGGGLLIKKFDSTLCIPSIFLNPLGERKTVRFRWQEQKFDWEFGQVPY